jgi:hypothetical protein
MAKERAARERAAKERAAKERAAKERAANERAANERADGLDTAGRILASISEDTGGSRRRAGTHR